MYSVGDANGEAERLWRARNHFGLVQMKKYSTCAEHSAAATTAAAAGSGRTSIKPDAVTNASAGRRMAWAAVGFILRA